MNIIPPLEDLKVFFALTQQQSFSKTAKQIGMSPAYVTKRIKLLEQQLGVTLLTRTSKVVSLTPEGRIAEKWARSLLEQSNQFLAELKNQQSEPEGTLRVVTSSGFGTQKLAPVLSQLARDFPALSIELDLLDRPVDILAEGYDLEIKVGGTPANHLIAKPLMTNHRILCASPDYITRHGKPTTLAELSQHPRIVIKERDQFHQRWKLQHQGQTISHPVSGQLTTNNGEVAKRWCLEGHGILLRSKWNVEEALRARELIHILPDYYQTADVVAVYSQRIETSAKLRVLIEACIEAWR